MKNRLGSLVTLLVLLVLPVSANRSHEQDDQQEAREDAFAEHLTGARLTGWFTDSLHPDAPPTKDSYTISRAEKSDGDKWLIEAVIGESGLKVPLYLPVQWSGDTPMITLDHFVVPQMGAFDARVIFHGESYAGVWRGEKHSGELMGHIERAPVEAGTKK